MLFDEGGQLLLGLLHPVVGLGGIDHGGIQHPAGAVHHGDLAAVAVAGVQPQHHLVLHRGLHQQVVEVLPEHLDGLLAGRFKEGGEGLVFHRRGDEPLPAVPGRGLHRPGAGVLCRDHPAADEAHRLFLRQLDGGLEGPFLHPPVDGQHPVGGDAAHRLGEVLVHGVGAPLLALPGAGHQAVGVDQPPQFPPDGGVIGQVLGDDIQGAGQGGFGTVHPLLLVQVIPGHHQGVGQGGLGEDGRRQRLQPLLPGDAAPGAALLLVGAVEVLHHRQGLGGGDGRLQFRGQLALFPDGGEHLAFALFQVAQVPQAVIQFPQGGILHAAGDLLAVPGDKGDGVALVDEPHRRRHLLLPEAQFLGQLLYHVHFSNSSQKTAGPSRAGSPSPSAPAAIRSL